MKNGNNDGTIGLLALAGGCALVAAAWSGCLTSQETVLTPAGTNAHGTVSYATNVVTVVNTNALAVDCLAIQTATSLAVAAAEAEDPALAPALADARTALGGLLNGANTNSVPAILGAVGTTNAAFATVLGPLVAEASALEQNLKSKYGASTTGQIVIAIVQAIAQGLGAAR